MPKTKQKLSQGLILEIFDVVKTPWFAVSTDIMILEKAAFGDKADSEERLKNCFENPFVTAVFLRNLNKNIIGYSYAIPDPLENVKMTALLDSAAIFPAYQGQGLIGILNDVLEQELVKKGYQLMTLRANIGNDFADKIAKVYAGRILETHENASIYGRQRYFKIKLR